VSMTIPSDWMQEADARLAQFKALIEAGLICKSGEFFPSVHYPPITMVPPTTQEDLFRTYTMPADGFVDVYAHLPFCAGRCLFCHYPVLYGPQPEAKARYLDALEKEMDLYMGVLGIDKIRPRSILVGGGTPTYLELPQFKRFLDFFCARMDLTPCRQFNYDVDPGTLVGPEGLERLRMMKDHGVNRLTIGVQSLNDAILRMMNRPHDVATALESIANSLQMGFIVNIEFIFGHPGQTLENWVEVIEHACTLGVEEIQLYRLKVERYGDFQGPIKSYKHIKADGFPSLDDTIRMKQLAISCLRSHGYLENLRRVFSRERRIFSLYAHRQCCELCDQIGLGLTAFSSLRDRFVLNTQYFEEYYKSIDEGRLPLNRGLVRSREEQMRWAIILPLKNRDVVRSRYERVAGVPLEQVFRPKMQALKDHGLIEETPTSIRLTPLGGFVADEVAEQFNEPAYVPYPRDEYTEGPLNPYRNADPFAATDPDLQDQDGSNREGGAS